MGDMKCFMGPMRSLWAPREVLWAPHEVLWADMQNFMGGHANFYVSYKTSNSFEFRKDPEGKWPFSGRHPEGGWHGLVLCLEYFYTALVVDGYGRVE